MRDAGDDEDVNDGDIAKLTVPELKILCRACSLTIGGRKQDLIARLVPCLEDVSALMNDGEDVNESDDELMLLKTMWKLCSRSRLC